MERGPPPASLPRTAPKIGIQTHPRPSSRGRDTQGPGRWQRGGRGPATGAELRIPAREKQRPPGGASRWVQADPYLLQSGSHAVARQTRSRSCSGAPEQTGKAEHATHERRGAGSELHRPGATRLPALRTRRLWNLREDPPHDREAPPSSASPSLVPPPGRCLATLNSRERSNAHEASSFFLPPQRLRRHSVPA